MYGRADQEWDELVSAGTRFLAERAQLGRTTSYTELNAVLAQRTGIRPFDFQDASERAAMGRLLGRIVAEDYPARGYMISALVIYLDGNDAGSGFYALAREMGLLASKGDRTEFWLAQLNGVLGR